MSNDDVIDVEAKGERGTLVSPGRPKGSKNSPFKTRDFREFVAGFLDRNADNIERWLLEVANGKPSQVVEPDLDNGIPGGIIPGTDPDPAKAVDLAIRLAEFAAPKQGRMLVANDPENPFQQPVLNVTIGGKRIDVTQGSTTPRNDGND